jgi:hypothetical protein
MGMLPDDALGVDEAALELETLRAQFLVERAACRVKAAPPAGHHRVQLRIIIVDQTAPLIDDGWEQ